LLHLQQGKEAGAVGPKCFVGMTQALGGLGWGRPVVGQCPVGLCTLQQLLGSEHATRWSSNLHWLWSTIIHAAQMSCWR
jgi:hypothetical protein